MLPFCLKDIGKWQLRAQDKPVQKLKNVLIFNKSSIDQILPSMFLIKKNYFFIFFSKISDLVAIC